MPRLAAWVAPGAALMLTAAAARADDFATTARSIIPSGQFGGFPVPPGADTRAKMYDALSAQIFGQGGGGEAPRSELLASLQRRLGRTKGMRLFDDLTEHADADAPSTLTKAFPYARIPRRRPGNVILDPGSIWPTDRAASKANARTATTHGRWASNFLMVSRRRSATGHPLFVAGPQIGYFYPGLTLEADVKGPGFEARGATAPGFAGNILIGRGPDSAWSLTSAGSDLIDTYVETLCGHSRTRYLYKGPCRRMGRVDAGVIEGAGRVVYRTTVHGPVTAYAKVHGRTVALSRKRASYGRDILWQLPFRAMTLNHVKSAKSFIKAMAESPFTFNAAYADDLHRRRHRLARQGPAHARGDALQGPVPHALLRAREQGALRAGAVGGLRPGGRRPAGQAGYGGPGRVALGRRRGADPLRPWAAADHDPLHEPPERDPAGDHVRRPSVR